MTDFIPRDSSTVTNSAGSEQLILVVLNVEICVWVCNEINKFFFSVKQVERVLITNDVYCKKKVTTVTNGVVSCK